MKLKDYAFAVMIICIMCSCNTEEVNNSKEIHGKEIHEQIIEYQKASTKAGVLDGLEEHFININPTTCKMEGRFYIDEVIYVDPEARESVAITCPLNFVHDRSSTKLSQWITSLSITSPLQQRNRLFATVYKRAHNDAASERITELVWDENNNPTEKNGECLIGSPCYKSTSICDNEQECHVSPFYSYFVKIYLKKGSYLRYLIVGSPLCQHS